MVHKIMSHSDHIVDMGNRTTTKELGRIRMHELVHSLGYIQNVSVTYR